MRRDRNPKHWKLWVFYYNPDEPRLLVARRTGTPWAFNFAKPMAWVIIAVVLAIPTAFAVLEHFQLVH
jgi:uncharacterized membrane protein